MMCIILVFVLQEFFYAALRFLYWGWLTCGLHMVEACELGQMYGSGREQKRPMRLMRYKSSHNLPELVGAVVSAKKENEQRSFLIQKEIESQLIDLEGSKRAYYLHCVALLAKNDSSVLDGLDEDQKSEILSS